eukprot:g23388.t1
MSDRKSGNSSGSVESLTSRYPLMSLMAGLASVAAASRLGPPLVMSVSAAATIGAVFLVARFRLKTARPNEWMLVIRDGKMLRAGVGIQHFASLDDEVVKFPSSIQKVTFTAQQVTQEMQGVQISGFCMWTIFRDDDGPFKAYRYLDGLSASGLAQANTNMTSMAESVIRAQVAKMTIQEVLKNREVIRESCKKALMEVVKGWGIWLETVEVTDVRILSDRLFQNMQSEYREQLRETSEKNRLKVQASIDESQILAQTNTEKKRAEAQTNARLAAAQSRLEEEKQKHVLAQEEQKVKLSAQALDVELRLKQLEDQAMLNKTNKIRQLELEQMEHKQKMEFTKMQLETEQAMEESNFRKLQLDVTKGIYEKLPIREMRVVNVCGANGSKGLESLLPAVAGAYEMVQAQKE